MGVSFLLQLYILSFCFRFIEQEADMMKRLLSRNSFDAETEEACLEKQPKHTRQFLLGYPGKHLYR